MTTKNSSLPVSLSRLSQDNGALSAEKAVPVRLNAIEREELSLAVGIPHKNLFLNESDIIKAGRNPICLIKHLEETWVEHNITAILEGKEVIEQQIWALVIELNDTMRLFTPSEAELYAEAERELLGAKLQPGSKPLDPADLMSFWTVVAHYRRLCMHGSRLWQASVWPGLNAAQKAAALGCVVELEALIPILSSRHPWHMSRQRNAIQKCMIFFNLIAGYLGDGLRVRNFAGVILGHTERWAALQEAALTSQWRRALEPFKYLAKVTAKKYREIRPDSTTCRKDSQGILHRGIDELVSKQTDALYHASVTLEEIAETPDEAFCERRFSRRSLSELLRAAKGNSRLFEYVNARIQRPQWPRREIWRLLGLCDDEGRAVDKQYRRLLQRLKAGGVGMEWRTIPRPWAAEASQTTYFEVLANGARGFQFGLYQHKLLKTGEK